jgi:DNA-binding response OmpR family regulator
MNVKAVIVDDDPQVLSLAGAWLRSAGCDAMLSSCFADARVQIGLFEPTILIADVRLDGFNGIQLGMLARRVRSDVRVLFISGVDDPVLRRDIADLGATFLQKPFRADALLNAVGLSRRRKPRRRLPVPSISS